MRKLASKLMLMTMALSLVIMLPLSSAQAAGNDWSAHIRHMNAKTERGLVVCGDKTMTVSEARRHLVDMKVEWLKANKGQGTANFTFDCEK